MPASKFEKTLPTLGSGKISESILREKALHIPESYIRVVKPQYLDDSIEQGTELFYRASLKNFTQLIESQILEPQGDAFYFYKQKHHSEILVYYFQVTACNFPEKLCKIILFLAQ